MSGEHLREAAWESLMLGELDAAARAEAHAHIVACERCSKIYKGLLAVEREARAFDTEIPRPLGRLLIFRPVIIASVAIAASVLAFLIFRPPPEPTHVRGATGVVVETIAPFSWKAIPGAETYRVELFDAGGRSVWKSGDVANTELDPPAVDPGVYFWQVEARAGGRTIGESKLSRFEVDE